MIINQKHMTYPGNLEMLRLLISVILLLYPGLSSAAKLRNHCLLYHNQAEGTDDSVGLVVGIVDIFRKTGGRCSAEQQEEYYTLQCTRPDTAAPPAKLSLGGLLQRTGCVVVDQVQANGKDLPEDEWVTLLINFRIASQRAR